MGIAERQHNQMAKMIIIMNSWSKVSELENFSKFTKNWKHQKI